MDFTALHFLARQKAEGNWNPLETAVIFLSHGVDPDIIGVQKKSHNDRQKATALKLAYLYDNQPMFRLLLEASTNVNLVYEENRLPHKPYLGTDTLLKIAIEKNDLSMVKTLVAYKADLFYAEKGHRRSLFAFATKNASLEIIQFLLEAYPFLLTERKEIWHYEFPLNAAAKNDRIDVLQCLFSKGMDIHQVDSSGRGPLHYAGSREMVDFMISQGLDVNQRDQAGNTPLHRIANQRNPDVIKALLEYGADPRLQNNVGMTPLHTVIHSVYWNKETAVALIEAGASVHTQDYYGRSFISKQRSAKKLKVRSKRHREIEEILTDLHARENDNESKE
jgi:ankyrin repeat protein